MVSFYWENENSVLRMNGKSWKNAYSVCFLRISREVVYGTSVSEWEYQGLKMAKKVASFFWDLKENGEKSGIKMIKWRKKWYQFFQKDKFSAVTAFWAKNMVSISII